MRLPAAVLLSLLLVIPASAADAARRKIINPPALRIHVVSNRTDVISAGDALVRIERRKPIRFSRIRVTAGRRDVTRAFAKRSNGKFDRSSNIDGVEQVDVPGVGRVCELDPAQTKFGTPATVAGESIATDTNKCALRPLQRSDHYPKSFTDAQWAALEKAFPTGVCDWSKPGAEQQATIPWQTYQDASGSVVYGGRPLGAAPKRSGGGWASGAFSGWRAARTG